MVESIYSMGGWVVYIIWIHNRWIIWLERAEWYRILSHYLVHNLELIVSGIFHLIFFGLRLTSVNKPRKAKGQIKEDYCLFNSRYWKEEKFEYF